MPTPGKNEHQPIVTHDTDQTQAVADAERLVRAGVNNKDALTQGIGVARLIKAVGTNISPIIAKSIGLDKVDANTI
jgi:hypothetical protein